MRRITATTTEVVQRTTEVRVPDEFDASNPEHRDVLDSRLADIECGEDVVSRTLTIALSDGRRRVDATLDLDDLIDDEPGTWTFFGHWENDRIVVEYSIPGQHDDRRSDPHTWDQGLWAATGSGPTAAAALQALRDEYEPGGEKHPSPPDAAAGSEALPANATGDRRPTLDDFVRAYEAYDGQDVGQFIHQWGFYLDGKEQPCAAAPDGVHQVTAGSCDQCGHKNF